MAIYHLTAKTVSRGGASSAQGRFEYACRAGRFSHDADAVQHVQSGNMPVWAMENPGAYWNAADLHERANGRLFKQLEFALPRELNEEEQMVVEEEGAPVQSPPEQQWEVPAPRFAIPLINYVFVAGRTERNF